MIQDGRYFQHAQHARNIGNARYAFNARSGSTINPGNATAQL
jgi:hypothetical protein